MPLGKEEDEDGRLGRHGFREAMVAAETAENLLYLIELDAGNEENVRFYAVMAQHALKSLRRAIEKDSDLSN